MLISDCAEGKSTFEFKGFGGSWLVVFNGRCGVLLDPGVANMWRRRGAKRFDSLDGRSLAVIVPCAGRCFVVVFFLFLSMVRFLGLASNEGRQIQFLESGGLLHGLDLFTELLTL